MSYADPTQSSQARKVAGMVWQQQNQANKLRNKGRRPKKAGEGTRVAELET